MAACDRSSADHPSKPQVYGAVSWWPVGRSPTRLSAARVSSETKGSDTFPAITTTMFAHVAEGVDAAREELKGGADQLKVMAGGGIATPTDPIDMVQYTEEEIRAAVVEAASRRTYAFAHAYVPEAIVRAVRAGVRSIEHGNLIDAGAAAVMAEHGAFLVPPLVIYEQVAQYVRALRFPEASLAKLDAVLAAGRAAVELAAGAGVHLGFGTDLLGETHDAQSRELVLRAEVQGAAAALRSATVVNAALLGRSGDLGVISPGAAADLLLVDGDPLRDTSVLAGQGVRLDLIVRGGENRGGPAAVAGRRLTGARYGRTALRAGGRA